MTDLNFNTDVLDYMKASDDDLDQELHQDIVDHFRKYAIVVSEHLNFNQHAKEANPADYKNEITRYDRNRRALHNNCINDINIANRYANATDQPPFCKLPEGYSDIKDVNRTDIGNAILKWDAQYYDDLALETRKEFNLPLTVEHNDLPDNQRIDLSEPEIDPQDKIMEDYNSLSYANPYPMIKTDGSYRFIHMMDVKNQTPVDPDTAIAGCKAHLGRELTDDINDKLTAAKDQINVSTFTKTQPKPKQSLAKEKTVELEP